MRSRRLGVDGGRIGLTDRRTEVQGTDKILEGVDVDLMETGENNATLGILTNGNGRSFMNRGGIGEQEVAQLFVIDLSNGQHACLWDMGGTIALQRKWPSAARIYRGCCFL